LLSELISAFNVPNQGIASAQHLPGGVEFAFQDGLANPSAADGLAVERHCRQAMDDKVEFRTQFAQQFHIPAAPMPKHEIGPYAYAADLPSFVVQSLDKIVTALPAELLIEVNEQGGIDTERLDNLKFSTKRINQSGCSVRCNDGIGMTIERHNQRHRFMLTCVIRGLMNDLLVPQMNTIKKTNRDADSSPGLAQFAKSANYLHGLVGTSPCDALALVAACGTGQAAAQTVTTVAPRFTRYGPSSAPSLTDAHNHLGLANGIMIDGY